MLGYLVVSEFNYVTNEKQKARQGTLACLRVHAPSARPGSTPNSSSRCCVGETYEPLDGLPDIGVCTLYFISPMSFIGYCAAEITIDLPIVIN